MLDLGAIDWGGVFLLLVKPVISAVITSSLVTSFVIYRDRKKLKSGDRSGYVSVSINYESHHELHYGPLFERSLEDILRNSQAVNIVNRAVKRKKREPDSPVILLDVQSARFVYERIGDYVAEYFVESRLAHALGQPIIMGTYVLSLIFDGGDAEGERKLRLLVIEESLLYQIAETGRITIHSEKGAKRAEVIDAIAVLYFEAPERFGIKELAVRALSGADVTHYKPAPRPSATVSTPARDDLAAHGFF